MAVGGGGRFAALEGKLSRRPGVTDPGALAAFIGRKKYGKAKFQKLATKGRRKRTRLPMPVPGE
jgi:hypothetical protein